VVPARERLRRQAELKVPGISIHVVDVSRGVVAVGMRVALSHEGRAIADSSTSSKGLVEIEGRAKTGVYEAVFHVGAWYREQGVTMPPVPFLDVVTYRFGISDPDQHYHLPFKCTPWGYSCFRGGA
jgi:5-hydroxyisourate hydrolase